MPIVQNLLPPTEAVLSTRENMEFWDEITSCEHTLRTRLISAWFWDETALFVCCTSPLEFIGIWVNQKNGKGKPVYLNRSHRHQKDGPSANLAAVGIMSAFCLLFDHNQDSVGNLAELAISYLLWCRCSSTEVAHILLLWNKHLGLLCHGGGSSFLAGSRQRGGRKSRVCHNTQEHGENNVFGLDPGALQRHPSSTATAKLGQGVGCGFGVGWWTLERMGGTHHGLERSCTSEKQEPSLFLGLLQVLQRVSSFERHLALKCWWNISGNEEIHINRLNFYFTAYFSAQISHIFLTYWWGNKVRHWR